MHKFASSTKNVHRELKESLTTAAKVLNQYTKVKGKETSKIKEMVPLESSTKNTQNSCPSAEYQKKIQMDLENIQREQVEYQHQLDRRLEEMQMHQNTIIELVSKNNPERYSDILRKSTIIEDERRTDTESKVDVNMEALGGSKNQATTILKPSKTLPKRKPAIIVRRGNDTFPELLRTVKSNARTEVTGKNISKIRETRNGSLLIEVSGNEEDVERVKGEIARAMGPKESIRSSKQRNLVELRDLDVLTDGEEITSSVTQAYDLKTDEIRVINIRKTFDGSQAATILLPLEIANKLIGVGRLKIGLVYCRVKAGTRRVRCYRCLAFGHEARICIGPDRKKL